MQAMKKSIDWEVETAPLTVRNTNSNSHRVILRDDTHAILGVRSDKYAVFSNKELEELVNRVVNTSGYELLGYQEFKKGKRVIAYLKLDPNKLNEEDQKLSINRHTTNDYMLIGNAHDGSSALFVAFTNVLLRCENQFTLPLRIINLRHLNAITLTDDQVQALVTKYENERKQIYGMMERWSRIPASKELVDSLVSHLIPPKEKHNEGKTRSRSVKRLRDSIAREVSELGFNFWGVFNGVTHYTTHGAGQRIFGNPYSNGNKLNEKAIRFLQNRAI